ncbi:shikimate dehydrogenase [Microbacterium ulmi]|uniref:Shikimate dehydrogenase n=1 Tax=Microbacterium ulmi TaxID=179095 RepID=A0A7Y2M0R0_9MICO|nr:shikimate dehydrogenase [Microbacterium ulmi]NNH04267.1 shikimate dehydrogenase [Microbacterium ulmi]
MTERTRLAVWGDPIAHSRSPQLHTAAYRALGLDWTYERRRLSEAGFGTALAALDESWRGLSLTMPLKGVAFAAAATRDRRAEMTGAVNTLLLDPGGPRGFNTDVGGVVRTLREAGIAHVEAARVVGAGATATSALVALAELGARRVDVVARRPAAVDPLAALGERLDVEVVGVPFAASGHDDVDVTIATLPGDAAVPDAAADALAARGGLLLDVVYGHWPTALASAWERAGGRAIDGLGMLLHQAVLQIRIFTTGDVEAPLSDEDAVIAAMHAGVTGGPSVTDG